MPFKSKAQRAWMFANKPEMAKQWAEDTPAGTKLPDRAKATSTRATPKAKPRKKPDMGGGFHQ